MAINAEEINTYENQDSATGCPGGKAIDGCDTAEALLKNAEGFVPDRHLTAWDEVRHFNHLTYISVGCVACHKICTVKIEMLNRLPTGRARIAYQ
ncbi:MAG: hypothetical protein ACREGG_00205 [Candidatus Saccharimonadales bacterium]